MSLEDIRVKCVRGFFIVFLVVTFTLVIGNLIALNAFQIDWLVQLLSSIIIIILSFKLLLGYFVKKYNRFLKDNFLIKLINKSLRSRDFDYTYDKHVSKDLVDDSKLVKDGFVTGEDYISYYYNGETKIEFSDLSILNTQGKEIDRGIFMRVRLPKKQRHSLLVTLNSLKEKHSYENELEWGGKKLIKVDTGDAKLNESHRVFTSNLKYSSGLVEKIIKPLVEKVNGDCEIELSIKESDMYIFINNASLKFEEQPLMKVKSLNYLEENIKNSVGLVVDILDLLSAKKH